MQLAMHEYIPTRAPAAHTLLSELRERALTAYSRGESSAAEAAFLQFLERFPDDAEVRQTLGILALQTGRHAWASQLLSQVAEIRDSADLQDALGAAYCGLSQPHQALRCFERAAAMQVDHAPARIHRAQVLSHLGRHAEAAMSYARAIDLGMNSAEIQALHLGALAAVGRARESIAGHASLPQSAGAPGNSATALDQVNHYPAALTAADWVISFQPRSAAGVHQHRAMALKGMERLLERSAALAGVAPLVVSCLLSGLLGSELAKAAISVLDKKTRLVAAPPAARIPKQRVDVDPIVTAHLFGEVRTGSAPESATLAADLKLTGTLAVEDPLHGFAIISNAQNSRVYSVGDSFDGATLREVYQDHVILERDGASQSLRLPRPDSGAQPALAHAH